MFHGSHAVLNFAICMGCAPIISGAPVSVLIADRGVNAVVSFSSVSVI